MRREALALVLAMAIGSVAMVACDKQEQRAAVVPEASKTASNPNSGANVAMGTPPAEKKDATVPPVQGQVDTKEPAQRQDFEQKK